MNQQIHYKLVKGPDDITWVSIEPLMNDLKESVVELMGLTLPPEEEQGRNSKIMGLKATYEILGALVQEANLNSYKEKQSANTH